MRSARPACCVSGVWQAERKARTVGAAFAELRSLTKGSRYVFAVPRRKDRRNAFSKPLK